MDKGKVLKLASNRSKVKSFINFYVLAVKNAFSEILWWTLHYRALAICQLTYNEQKKKLKNMYPHIYKPKQKACISSMKMWVHGDPNYSTLFILPLTSNCASLYARLLCHVENTAVVDIRFLQQSWVKYYGNL